MGGEFLTLLVILLTVITLTLVGHGIWVLVAFLLRALMGSVKPHRQELLCPFCARSTDPDRDRCHWCGREIHGHLGAELNDLPAFRRQVRRFEKAGMIASAEAEALVACADARRQELLAQPAQQPTPKVAPPDAVDSQPPVPAPTEMVAVEVVAELAPSVAESQRHAPLPKPAARGVFSEVQAAAAVRSPEPSGPSLPPVELPPAPAARPPAENPPEPPRKSWLKTLAGIMEERDIPWAEPIGLLVGGLLIIGSSIALVINLWETLEKVPVFKFAVFMAVISMAFGVGLYIYHRWKLESTGRFVLMIAMLLVPLGFLAMASLSKEDWTMLIVGAELASLGVSTWLVSLAARVVVPQWRWWQVLAVMGNSAAVLLIARLTGEGLQGLALTGVGLVPAAVFAAVVYGSLRRWSQQAVPFLTLLGIAAFATAVAMGLLVAKGAQLHGIDAALDYTSVLFTLIASAVLADGLSIMRMSDQRPALGMLHTVGTVIAILSLGMLLAALGMAWPQPALLIAAGTFSTAILVWIAFRHPLPLAHAGAMACATLVYVTGFHLLAGHVPPLSAERLDRSMLGLLTSSQTGTALVGLVALFGAVAEWLARGGRRTHAVQYVGGCSVVALLSLAVVTLQAVRDPASEAPVAATVYALLGLGSLLLNARYRQPLLSHAGLGLLVGATGWTLWWQIGSLTPEWATFLGVEALGMGLIAARLRPKPALERAYRLPLLHVAEAVALLALMLAVGTAWPHRLVLTGTFVPPTTALFLTASWLCLAWVHRSPARTWIASAVALAGFVHTLVLNAPALAELPWSVALLGHATLAMLAGVLFEAYHRWWPQTGDGLRRVMSRPLGDSGLYASFLVPVAMFFGPWHTLPLTTCAFWLAAIWLVAAWTRASGALLAAAQAMLTLATLHATSLWLERFPWDPTRPIDLSDPRCLQAYGVGLALLGLLWIGARIATRPIAKARQLLRPPWPTVDRAVTHSVVAAQLLLVVWHLGPGLGHELAWRTAAGPLLQRQLEAVGPAAWLLAGLLAVAMGIALWDRWQKAELISTLLLGGTVPWLLAGPFGSQVATASALRWFLAVGFVLGMGLVCQRHRLAKIEGLHARLDLEPRGNLPGGDRLARGILVVATALPVLAITLAAAGQQLAGVAPAGPFSASWFAQVGPSVSYLVPLVLVAGGLLGLALRETSAGYAFSAGLVVEMIVTLGYLLTLAAQGVKLDTPQVAMVVQLAAITAAVWAIGWLIARRWVAVWREGPTRDAARVLMNAQLGLGMMGNVLLLVPALLAIVFFPPTWHGWVVAAGSTTGWIALGLVVAGIAYRQVQAGRFLRPQLAGLAGMAALGLLACTIRALLPAAPEWGYRALMLGWASYAVFVALATWWAAAIRTLPGAHGPPQVLIRAASTWVVTAGLLAVLLGLKLAWLHDKPEDLLWAAAGIAVASLAGATMAVWRRQEGWAFAAAPGVNLAASLGVWYAQNQLPFESWWTLLLEANVIATASVALVWLAARRRLYALRELTIRTTSLLGLQTALGVAGCVAMLAPPLGYLVWHPAGLPPWCGQLAAPPGWIALLLTAAAAGWYFRQVSPRDLMHVVGGLGLAVGILAACLPSLLNEVSPDLSRVPYYVLMASWAAVGLLVLGLGYMGQNLRLAEQSDPLDSRQASPGRAVFPHAHVRFWVTVAGTLTIGLALLHTVRVPSDPWWSLRAIAAVSLAFGLLAMWQRLPGYVWLAGLLINLAGSILWLAYGHWHLAALIHTNALCLALGSGLWSLVGHAHPQGVPVLRLRPTPWDKRPASASSLPFPPLALQLGLVLAAIVVVWFAAWDLTGPAHPALGPLGWSALSALALASVVLLWDKTVRLPLANLYGVGLLGVSMGAVAWSLSPRMLCWSLAAGLAGFALVGAAVGWLLPRGKRAWETLRIPLEDRGSAREWFPQAQLLLTGTAAGFSAWVSLDPGFDRLGRIVATGLPGQMIGPLAALLLLTAAILVARISTGAWRATWQGVAMGLGLLLMANAGWAWLDPAVAAPWLHRSVIAMSAAVVMSLLAGPGLSWALAPESDWAAQGRRMWLGLSGIALGLLAAIVVQEALLRHAGNTPFMALPAVVAVVVALAVLMVTAVTLAVTPRWDPLRLSDRGRTAYVYAAEALAGLVCLHLRLARPELFRLGILENYWMLIVMAVAFGGAILSELFHRRGFPVLSEPLERTAVLLPSVPAVAFWLPIHPQAALPLAGNSPALWFFVGLFYGLLAVTRRSFGFGLLAAVAANLGLWVLWDRLDWGFVEHPQIWLIPVGLTILIAEYVNHPRLSGPQSAGTRYLGLLLIYVPSSTEFLRAVGESLWLPMVLIGLSVLGVALGIVLRIRSFLFLGLTFLTLVLVTMIWYAAFEQQQMWVFWIFCIGLGLAILVLVGFYEKRRNDVLTAVRQLRQWER